MTGEKLEFTDEQIERVDEVENAVFHMCETLTEEEYLEWDISYVGEIADAACQILADHGFKIRYPAIVTDYNGDQKIVDYVPARSRKRNE